jgi:hypothetical protein
MRTLILGMVVCLVLVTAPGCGGHKEAAKGPRPKAAMATTPSARAPTATRAERSRETPAPEALVAAPPAANKAQAWKPRAEQEPQSGILTAGSFDDNLFPDPLRRFLGSMSQGGGSGDLAARLFGRRLEVAVRGRDNRPLGNARVRLTGSEGPLAAELVTRSDGRAVFLSSWDRVEGEMAITVTPPDGSAAVRKPVPRDAARFEISLPAAVAPLPRNLDLVLVLDTTGSMGDELAYLKSEIKSIAAAVAGRFPHVNQRYSLVVYRDRGDAYVVRTFPFTSSVVEFKGQLSAQRAEGGGDNPEAMECGLEEAAKLPWRTADTARVLFLVADAPPHTEDVGKAMVAVDVLRKKGVAIYPVACSGYDDTTELVMRTSALLTGGQFLFLTDDSGVGESHAEPHIPFYKVQRLDRLMIRMIAGELSGQRLEPQRDEVIRTVGNPPRANGSH